MEGEASKKEVGAANQGGEADAFSNRWPGRALTFPLRPPHLNERAAWTLVSGLSRKSFQ